VGGVHCRCNLCGENSDLGASGQCGEQVRHHGWHIASGNLGVGGERSPARHKFFGQVEVAKGVADEVGEEPFITILRSN